MSAGESVEFFTITKDLQKRKNVEFWFAFAKACGYAFMDSYIPIIEKRKNLPYSAENKHWQEIRRGRYTEFNLVHDRGALFLD